MSQKHVISYHTMYGINLTILFK